MEKESKPDLENKMVCRLLIRQKKGTEDEGVKEIHI
jgi:hypothetical protein